MTPCKVLVVEDREADAELALYHLSHMGFTVRRVSTAEAALAELRGSPELDLPQLVVVDIGLPGMSGTDLIHLIKKEFPAIPVVVSTATTPAEAHRDLLAAGAMAILAKPFQDYQSQLLLSALKEMSLAYERGRRHRTKSDYWRYGLAGAFVGGFSSMVESGVALTIIAPEKFRLDEGLWRTLVTILALALLNAVKMAAAHLKQSPLPFVVPPNGNGGSNGHGGQKGSDRRSSRA